MCLLYCITDSESVLMLLFRKICISIRRDTHVHIKSLVTRQHRLDAGNGDAGDGMR